jgi:hypothetical protein
MEQTLDFNITVDGAPYVVKAVSCHFNDRLQYTVTINDGEEIIFAFDPQLGRYAPVGDDTIDVSDSLEIEIGSRLNGKSMQQQ